MIEPSSGQALLECFSSIFNSRSIGRDNNRVCIVFVGRYTCRYDHWYRGNLWNDHKSKNCLWRGNLWREDSTTTGNLASSGNIATLLRQLVHLV